MSPPPPLPLYTSSRHTQLRMEKHRLKRDLADEPADNADGEGWVRSTLCAATRDIAAETRALRMLHPPDMRTPAQKRKDVEGLAAGGPSAIAAAADAAEAAAAPRRRAAREHALAAAALAPPPAWPQQNLLAVGGGGLALGGGQGGVGAAAASGGGGGAVKEAAAAAAAVGGGGGAAAGSAAAGAPGVGVALSLEVDAAGVKTRKGGPETLSPR